MELDLEYIDEWSILGDVIILAQTLPYSREAERCKHRVRDFLHLTVFIQPDTSESLRSGSGRSSLSWELMLGTVPRSAHGIFEQDEGRTGMTTENLLGRLTAADHANDPGYTDHLTGIWNRRFFERALEHCLDPRNSPWGAKILLLDLDRFKAVNDSLGHAIGDTLLCLVTQRVNSILGKNDVFARLGGDEFGILTSSEFQTEELAARLIELIRRTYLIDGCPVNIGVSIGVSSAPEDARERGELMRCADLALYQAKLAGRNCFAHFESAMAVKAQEMRDLEIALRKAVALKQLVLQYRPQMDVSTKRVTGVEAVLL
jgi:diguanylate cyclase (GGDEF)-like protein